MTTTNRQLTLFPERLEHEGLQSFSIRPSSRAKRLTIKVYPRGRVEVVVPRRTRAATVEAFVRENAAWIRDARRSFAIESPPDVHALPTLVALRAVGKSVPVVYRPVPGAITVDYRVRDDRLQLSGRVGDETLCITALRRYLAETARSEFEPALRSLSSTMDLPYSKMQIRAQRTCWGSRSSSGTVSLNLCLLFLEPQVVRYLMIHELCHGRHMNHSKRFWALVSRFEPDCRRLDRELTESWRHVPGWMGIC
ncbi:MAG: SprT family zinc-dependent metalloprotease [Woeseia sp.]